MTRAAALFLALPILFLGTLNPLVAQDGDDLRLEPRTAFSFGQELEFSLQATNAAAVDNLTLSFRPQYSRNSYQVDVPFSPGDAISVTQVIDVNTIDIQPFSTVSYFWTAAAGAENHSTPEQELAYGDDRFPWQSLVRDGITVHWTGGTPFLGQIVLDTAAATLSDLQDVLSPDALQPIDIYVYPSSADIRSVLERANIDESSQEHLERGLIFVTAVNEQTAESDLELSVPYETAQLMLYREAGSRFDAVPWWLKEGLALNARKQSNQRQAVLLDEALVDERTFPLWRLCGMVQETGDRAELAGIQSESLVRFIRQNRAPDAIARLLDAYNGGDNCEEGVQRVLGSTLDELDEDWLSAQQASSTSQSSVLGEVMVWILLILAGAALAGLLIYSTNRSVHA